MSQKYSQDENISHHFSVKVTYFIRMTEDQSHSDENEFLFAKI